MDRQDQHVAHERKIVTSADQLNTEPGRDSLQKLRIRHAQVPRLKQEQILPRPNGPGGSIDDLLARRYDDALLLGMPAVKNAATIKSRAPLTA